MKAYVVAPETIHDQAMFGEYAKAGGIMATYPTAAWFETRGVAALLTMRV
jgi:hypothetical protein